MIYLSIIVVLFLFYCFMSVVDVKYTGNMVTHRVRKNDEQMITFLSVVFLILFVTFRPESMPDYKSYILDFKYMDKYRDLSMEIGDKLLIQFVHIFTDKSIYVFFAFALIGVPLKIYAIRKIVPFYFLSMAVYVSGILIAQDMIAIRSSIAVGFFFWAIKYRIEKDYKKCILFSVLSVAFHYSAIIIALPLCFFSTNKIRKFFYALLLPLSYAVVLSGFGITQFFDLIRIEKFQQLWAYYSYTDEDTAYNVFNLFILGKCAVYYFILFNIEKISQHHPESMFYLKIFGLSLASTVLLYESQSIAIRVGEFLGAIEILLIPSVLFAFKNRNRIIGSFICTAYCLGLLLCYGRLIFGEVG